MNKLKDLNTIKIGNETLTPLKGRCSKFSEEVKKLTRPYRAISESDYKKLMSRDADYYRDQSGITVTFGCADGGYAIMPLIKNEDRNAKKQVLKPSN